MIFLIDSVVSSYIHPGDGTFYEQSPISLVLDSLLVLQNSSILFSVGNDGATRLTNSASMAT